MRPASGLPEWVLASGLLILAVVLLRAVFGKRMGAGARYALWGVVLLRLLVPVQLFTIPVPAAVRETELSRPVQVGALPATVPTIPGDAAPASGEAAVDSGALPAPEQPRSQALDASEVFGRVWLAGSAAVAAVFVASNVSFARRLKRVRRTMDGRSPVSACGPTTVGGACQWHAGAGPRWGGACQWHAVPHDRGDSRDPSSADRVEDETRTTGPAGGTPSAHTGAGDCSNIPLPVYLAEGLPSPCLFGVFRPAVYVTPGAAADPGILRHVLAHEYTHFRHGDHIWNLLRGAVLALHWWNPLVWLAAGLSRRDCELACDEGTLRRLGEGERFAYGRTLLALVTAQTRPADLLSCATTMTGDGRSVAQRVKRIARAPRRWLWAAVAAVLLAALVTVCAFGQVKQTADPSANDPQLPWAEGADSLRYVRDKGGFPDEFAIRLHRDGSFSYFEGSLSSYIGVGTWTQEGDVICLMDGGAGKEWRFRFQLTEDALVFRAGESDRFLYVDVAGGERFSLDPDPPEADWFDDRTRTSAPAPEEAAALHPAYSLLENANQLSITGLDCGGAIWCAEFGPVIVARRDDLADAETLGCLSISQPRFLGEAFSAKGGELLSIYYPEEGPLLFFGFEEYTNGRLYAATASVYAFVDLAAGTVQEKEVFGFEERTEEFSDKFLVATARTLAGLIRDAAGYYDETTYNTPVVRALDEEVEQGRNPDLLLAYRGKEARFSGLWKHEAHDGTTGTVADLDGDGKGEIVAILYAGGGTGAAVSDLYVFDSETLEQFDTANVTQMILDSIRSTGDAENFYLAGPGGLNAVISREEVRRGYQYGDIPMDDTLHIGSIVGFRVENGVVHCDLPCSSFFVDNYIGAMDVTLSFSRTEGFRCVKAEYAPYEDAAPSAPPAPSALPSSAGAAQSNDKAAEAQKDLEAAQAEPDRAAKEEAAAMQAGGQGWVEDKEQFDAFQKKLEEEQERRQMEEYQAVGVTMDGKKYYYQGQLVNIFLDIRANGSFYTLDTDPAGTVNVRILRDGNGKVTGAAIMTEAEAAQLLGDMRDPEDG